ncbi:MAG: lipoprotein [Chitinophagaceae bacterium]|nr:lipoprotein [Chitinophagaceae bacterium]MBP6046812.1 lipoprotein [Ferruginibacter sp.]MBK7087758.1 lipoprotein [Chitinophagaceae bacterium]MBK7346520.1 lipoprotein [Chitinophagaceae bacterium]MBK7735557.1 lipoprotein [Chitinophagaceae bacterium]
MKKLFTILGIIFLLSSCSRSITMDQAASGYYKKSKSIR